MQLLAADGSGVGESVLGRSFSKATVYSVRVSLELGLLLGFNFVRGLPRQILGPFIVASAIVGGGGGLWVWTTLNEEA